MEAGTIIFIASFLLLDLLLRKKFPGFYKRIQLPVNITVSVLALTYCALLIYALHEVLNSGVSGGDKLFFTLLVLISLGAFVYMTTSLWRRWLREGRKDAQALDDMTGGVGR